jgi:NTP pyrophosphatase (non-canonical NTP hydrolase)
MSLAWKGINNYRDENKGDQMTLIELEQQIVKWAENRGIFKEGDVRYQLNKATEELGEVASCLNKGQMDSIKKEIGDVVVTMIVLSIMVDSDILECLTAAYEKNVDREGEMVSGGYVKEEDLK